MKKLLFILLAAVSCSRADISPVQLTCEYSESAVIDIKNPRLSWINENPDEVRGAVQTAYRIQVADAEEGFDSPVWDTGMTGSDQSAFIEYDGAPLKSRTTYLWRVKVWDGNGRESC